MNVDDKPDNNKKQEGCGWCREGINHLTWDVMDDEIGKYVPRRLIFYCFHCGRKLQEDNK